MGLGGRRKKKKNHSEGNKEKLPIAKATSQDAPFLATGIGCFFVRGPAQMPR